MVYILLGDGFEEAEAILPADLLRRAGVEVSLVGLEGPVVTGSHGIAVTADVTLEDRQGNSLAEATLHPISGTVRSLRPGEKQSLSWAVSVESVETARRLAENAETVRIRVSIRQIVYTNGKVKNY